MPNMFIQHETLIELKKKAPFLMHQNQFIAQLIDGKIGKNGWRPFIEIAKNPPAMHKLDHIQAMITVHLHAVFGSPSYRKMLLTTQSVIRSDLTPDAKIEQIKAFIIAEATKNGLPDLACIWSIVNANFSPTNDISQLVEALEAEIKRTTFWDFSYKKALKNTLSGLSKFCNVRIDRRIKNRDEKALVMDALYAMTNNYGKIMLPIAQGEDSRLADSGGECFGYVATWAKALLEKNRFLGIEPNQLPPFQVIKYNSGLGRTYPDLNHLAILTSNTSLFQRLQGNKTQLRKALPLNISNYQRRYFFKSHETLVEKLITTASKNTNNIYLLSVVGYLSGHALGFCKRDDHYHFFDSNLGWIRFNDEESFKYWFPIYFKAIGYSQLFYEAAIDEISLCQPQEIHEPITIKTVFLFVLLSPILLPVMLLIACGSLAYQFVIRGIFYAGIAVFHGLKTFFSSDKTKEKKAQVADDQGVVAVETSIQHLPSAGTLFTSLKRVEANSLVSKPYHQNSGLLFTSKKQLHKKPVSDYSVIPIPPFFSRATSVVKSTESIGNERVFSLG